jgi:hypothetical protein
MSRLLSAWSTPFILTTLACGGSEAGKSSSAVVSAQRAPDVDSGVRALPTADIAQTAPRRFDSTDVVVAGLSQGMDSAAVRRLLGQPDSIAAEPDPRDPPATFVDWHYPTLTVTLGSYNALGGVTLTGASVATLRGLRVGDTRSRLVALYGEPRDTTGDTWQYETADGRYLMQVDFVAGRIQRLYLGHLYD